MKALEACGLVKRYGPGCGRCLTSTGARAESNLCPHCGTVVALNQVSLTLAAGEILGIMGESGSGKSTLLKALCFELATEAGSAWLHPLAPHGAPGEPLVERAPIELFALNAARARALRDQLFGIVHQNPRQGLAFDISVGGNIAERLVVAGRRNFAFIRRRAAELLSRTRVPIERMDELPGGFSGGMQQRVQIAKALAAEPQVLFLDEITSGLDLSVQARILDLILELHQELKLSVLVVTHDIGVVKLLASETLIMRCGEIVERGLTDQILEDPQHPYTQELISAAL